MARKTRSDSPLKALAPERREAVARLCAEHGLTGAIGPVKALTGLTHGVTLSSLSRFCAWHRLATALERNRDDAAAFEELLRGREDLAVDARRAREIGQVYFERRVLAADDPQLYFAWLKDRREAARLELDRERLERDNRVARQALALDRARLLLTRQKRGETGADLQEQIDLFLEEIERMKRGEDPA